MVTYIDGQPASGSFDKASQINMNDGRTVEDAVNSKLNGGYITLGIYTSLYTALQNAPIGISYCGIWGLNNFTDKPSGVGNDCNMVVLIRDQTFYYSKVIILTPTVMKVGALTSSTATSLSWY